MNKELFSVIYNNKNKSFKKYYSPKNAYLYYRKRRVDLISGESEIYPVKKFADRLNELKLNRKFSDCLMIHLFYEFGSYYVDKLEIQDEDILALEIKYEKSEEFIISKPSLRVDLAKISRPSLKEYSTAFDKGYEHLLRGDCYQFNLTYQYLFNFNSDASEYDFINTMFSNLENIGGYAHVTSVPYLDKLFLSNSPECLFQARVETAGVKLWSMPIKGSLKIDDAKSFREAWQQLQDCKKNEPELFMITDLLRNDLSKIERPLAKVIKRKCPLKVPGILHQYSLIKVQLSSDVTLGKVLQALYPGGSITGAPKIRVMKILKNIENDKRGFYTGSTIVIHKEVMASSINIRSAVVDFKNCNLSYGAGGGITLQSSPKLEYLEMELKVESFLKLFS